MKRAFALLLLLGMVACGKAPVFLQPTDNQTFVLGQFSCIQAALQDYSNTTITFRGQQEIGQNFTCQNGTNGPAQCCMATGMGGGYSGGTCSNAAPCTLTIIATQGTSNTSVRTVNISSGN